MKFRYLMASLWVASVVVMGAVGSARAADEWFVLGEQALNAASPSVEIKSSGGRWTRRQADQVLGRGR
jgi:hypothetical protein